MVGMLLLWMMETLKVTQILYNENFFLNFAIRCTIKIRSITLTPWLTRTKFSQEDLFFTDFH